ncbi:hypothetical protein ANN_18232 [Periplaneta americana]|uniref:Uncharacterized protein n=1 Tax=Periplaneta americana TaxID=6978 RepID=A0ABQ8SPC4_PERAM|nr:hypothetical protein ANN_18232 [Periplaneta americana]
MLELPVPQQIECKDDSHIIRKESASFSWRVRRKPEETKASVNENDISRFSRNFGDGKLGERCVRCDQWLHEICQSLSKYRKNFNWVDCRNNTFMPTFRSRILRIPFKIRALLDQNARSQPGPIKRNPLYLFTGMLTFLSMNMHLFLHGAGEVEKTRSFAVRYRRQAKITIADVTKAIKKMKPNKSKGRCHYRRCSKCPPHIDVSLTCEHDPKLQEYCVCPQNMPQFDSEGIPNQAPETNKPIILNGPTSRNREGSDQVSVEAKQLGQLYLSIDQETFDPSTGEPYD